MATLLKAFEEYQRLMQEKVEQASGREIEGVQDMLADEVINAFAEMKKELGIDPAEIDEFAEAAWEIQGPSMMRVINMALATGQDPIKILYSSVLDVGINIGKIHDKLQADELRQILEGDEGGIS